MEHKLFVGYSRQVVEPTESILLGGYSNGLKRFHTAMTEKSASPLWPVLTRRIPRF